MMLARRHPELRLCTFHVIMHRSPRDNTVQVTGRNSFLLKLVILNAQLSKLEITRCSLMQASQTPSSTHVKLHGGQCVGISMATPPKWNQGMDGVRASIL